MSRFTLSAFADEINSNLQVQMEVLKTHHIDFLEIRGVSGRNIVEFSLQEAAEIKKQLDAHGIKVSAIGSPIGKIMITDDFEPTMHLFRYAAEVARILDTNYIRIFSFFMPELENPSKYRSEVISRLKEIVKIAEEKNIILLHENEKNIYGDTAARCLDILKTINSKCLRATFDPANFIQCNEIPFPDSFKLLEEYIEYIHIKDVVSASKTIVPAGQGDGRIQEMIEYLHQKGFNGFLSLEPHLQPFAGLQSLEPHSKISEKIPEDGRENFAAAVAALKNLLTKLNRR